MELSIVIPAYNEEKRLPRTLQTLLKQNADGVFDGIQLREVIVADDGSVDQTEVLTRELASAFSSLSTPVSLQVIKGAINRGKGHAVRTGLLAATSEWALVADADMATPWEEILKLKRAVERSDLAIGSRDIVGSEIEIRQSWIREHMGKVFNLIVRGLTGLPFKDTQCGFKLLKMSKVRPFLKGLGVDRYAWDVELLLSARDHGLEIVETPVRWRHINESKVHPIRDSSEMLWTLCRLRFQRGFRKVFQLGYFK